MVTSTEDFSYIPSAQVYAGPFAFFTGCAVAPDRGLAFEPIRQRVSFGKQPQSTPKTSLKVA